MTRPPSLPDRIETVLLDAGGVLVDLDYGYLIRLVEARHGRVDKDQLSRLEALARREINARVADGGRVSEQWRDYFRLILSQLGLPIPDREDIIDSLWEAHQRFGLWTVPIDGGPETVAELKGQGYRIGVVSNAEGRVEQDLESAGYRGLLETVVDSFVVGVEKPDPGIFHLALERLGVPADTAVHLGDVPSVDVEGARAAGIAPILLDRHELYPTVDAPRVRSIRELPAYLGRSS